MASWLLAANSRVVETSVCFGCLVADRGARPMPQLPAFSCTLFACMWLRLGERVTLVHLNNNNLPEHMCSPASKNISTTDLSA